MGRLSWIDSAKGMGIILVILGHSNIPFPVEKLIYVFHMPLFFIISGYLFQYEKYRDHLQLLIKNKYQRIIFPYFCSFIALYLIWVIIKWIVNFCHISYQNEIFNVTLFEAFVSLLYGNGTETGPAISKIPSVLDYPINLIDISLWFLPALFCSLIVLYAICFIFDRYGAPWGASITVITIISGYICGLFLYLPWGFDIACVCLLFSGSGYLFRKYHILEEIERRRYIITVFPIVIGICCLMNNEVDITNRVYGNGVFFYFGGVAGTLLIFYIASFLNSSPQFRDIGKKIGAMSLLILIFHIPVVDIFLVPVQALFPEVSSFAQEFWICWFLLSFGICIAIWHLLGYVPSIRKVFAGG